MPNKCGCGKKTEQIAKQAVSRHSVEKKTESSNRPNKKNRDESRF